MVSTQHLSCISAVSKVNLLPPDMLASPVEIESEQDRAVAIRDATELCQYQVAQHLSKTLHRVIIIAGPEAYPSWPIYAAALAERGGVIEACAAGVIGSPCANLFIDPTGGVRLISTHEQIFCPPYRAIGSSFPQSSVPPTPLTQAALAVGRACYEASKRALYAGL